MNMTRGITGFILASASTLGWANTQVLDVKVPAGVNNIAVYASTTQYGCRDSVTLPFVLENDASTGNLVLKRFDLAERPGFDMECMAHMPYTISGHADSDIVPSDVERTVSINTPFASGFQFTVVLSVRKSVNKLQFGKAELLGPR